MTLVEFEKTVYAAAFALIRQGKRIFGADNTGGWHTHPFHSPEQHIPQTQPITFAQFLSQVEKQIDVK